MLRRLFYLNPLAKNLSNLRSVSTSCLRCQRYDDFEDEGSFQQRGAGGGGGGGGGGQRGWDNRGDFRDDRGMYGGGRRYDYGGERSQQGGYGAGRRFEFQDGGRPTGGYGYGRTGGQRTGGLPLPIDPEKQKRSVFVASLPWLVKESELVELFSQVGKVQEFRIIYDRVTGRSKGFGFCEFAEESSVKAAVEKLNNVEFNGRNLLVNYTKGSQSSPSSSPAATPSPAAATPSSATVTPSSSTSSPTPKSADKSEEKSSAT